MKLSSRRHQVRITSPKRLIIAAVILLSIPIAAVVFWPRQEVVNEYATPASIPCYRDCDTSAPVAYSLPLRDGNERSQFAAEATQLESELALYTQDGWGALKGTPVSFDAYIPPASLTVTDPDYVVSGDRTYVRAVILPPQDPGYLTTVVEAEGDSTVAPRYVVLGFATEDLPRAERDQFLRVLGVPYWTSANIPRRNTAPLDVPVIEVGAFESVSAAELLAPAQFVYRPNLVVREGNFQLSVEEIAFASQGNQTRVEIRLNNLSTTQTLSWPSENATLIDAEGNVHTPTGIADNLPGTTLSTTDIPIKVVRSGTLFFPYVAAERGGVTLNLPGLQSGTEQGGADTIRIAIPGLGKGLERVSAPVATGSGA